MVVDELAKCLYERENDGLKALEGGEVLVCMSNVAPPLTDRSSAIGLSVPLVCSPQKPSRFPAFSPFGVAVG